MQEAPAPMKTNFAKHDINGDGLIDAEEAKLLPAPRNQGESGGGTPPPQ